MPNSDILRDIRVSSQEEIRLADNAKREKDEARRLQDQWIQAARVSAFKSIELPQRQIRDLLSQFSSFGIEVIESNDDKFELDHKDGIWEGIRKAITFPGRYRTVREFNKANQDWESVQTAFECKLPEDARRQLAHQDNIYFYNKPESDTNFTVLLAATYLRDQWRIKDLDYNITTINHHKTPFDWTSGKRQAKGFENEPKPPPSDAYFYYCQSLVDFPSDMNVLKIAKSITRWLGEHSLKSPALRERVASAPVIAAPDIQVGPVRRPTEILWTRGRKWAVSSGNM